MGSSQFEAWMASEADQEMQDEQQARQWALFLTEQASDDESAMLADPAYHALLDAQEREFMAVVNGEAA